MASRPACFALLALLAGFGCDSTGETSGTTTTAMTIKISSPTEGACVEVPTDRAASVPITISTTGITLLPPGTCGATAACGYIELAVGDVANNSGTAQVIDLFSTPEVPLSGTIVVTATLRSDAGSAYTGADDKPLTAKLTFEAKVSCGGGTGGTGGSTTTTGGAGGAGGNTSTGGAGGNTSTGGAGGNTSTGGAGGNTSTGGAGGNTSTGGAGGNTSTGGAGGNTGGTGGI